MKFRQIKFFGFLCVIFTLCACGGSGGGSSSQPTTATLKLSTAGALPQETSLSGVGITVTLPDGVTVRTDAGGAVASGVAAVTGVAAPGTVLAVYTPASGGNPGKIALAVASGAPAGFGMGEFAAVHCDIASGHNPKQSDFSISGFNPIDLSGASVSGLTANLAAEIQ